MAKQLPRAKDEPMSSRTDRMLKRIQKKEGIWEFYSGRIGPDGKDIIDLYYSKEPSLELSQNRQPLEITFSSVEEEDNKLLHFLLSKSKA